ncbi:hypothetical protein B0H19DRAFT_1142303 [Mycena capillaripes]|nr:hypothetical protein B0H19DRAFT_1142303 [Mycena capillaripes]
MSNDKCPSIFPLARRGLIRSFLCHRWKWAVQPRQPDLSLKHLGVRITIAFSAVGSLLEEIAPGDFALSSQIIDRTKGAADLVLRRNGVRRLRRVQRFIFTAPCTWLADAIREAPNEEGEV